MNENAHSVISSRMATFIFEKLEIVNNDFWNVHDKDLNLHFSVSQSCCMNNAVIFVNESAFLSNLKMNSEWKQGKNVLLWCHAEYIYIYIYI